MSAERPPVPTRCNRVGGQRLPTADERWIEDHNPATGQLLARVPRSGAAEVDAAVKSAQAALDGEWGRFTAEERAGLLERTAAVLERESEALARLESEDQGKPVALARRMDIPRAIANFRFFAAALRATGTGAHLSEGVLNYTTRRPLGVVALITPWNLPLYLLSWKTAPALAMGNAVVAKPSELTPLTADALADALEEAGAPPGAFNVVHGYGAEAGQALIGHPEVSGISFTGGTVTGRQVAATAAPMLKKLSLELGGRNPTVVFADAAVDAAVDGALRAAFTNQGEICLCGSRILVQRPIYARFAEELTRRARGLRVGDPADARSDLGALVSPQHLDKVEGYIALARAEGGEVLCGGGRPSLPAPFDGGAFLEPTVIAGLAPSCRAASEEIFGPVVTLHPFDTEEEALRVANGVRYGLSASLWTQDLARAHRFAEALDVGLVWVNTWMLRDLRTPFGGVKDSGVGREGGTHSFDFFSESKNICIKY